MADNKIKTETFVEEESTEEFIEETEDEETAPHEEKTLFNFTREGKVIYANSLEEAQEIYLNEKKESENG